MTRDYLNPRPGKVDAPKKVVLRSILKKPGSSKRNSASQQSTPVESASLADETPPPSSQMQSQGNAKRKAMTQCRNCGREYNLSNADALACTHHPGTYLLPHKAIETRSSIDKSIQASEKSTPSTKYGMTLIQMFSAMRGR